MVFGLSRKEHRIPDLSRYDYYYKNKDNEESNHRLSAAAAYAASTGSASYEASNRTGQPARAQSMTHGPGLQSPQNRRKTPARAPSAAVMNTSRSSGVPPNYRTYSLRSQTSGQVAQGRASSITSANKYKRTNQARPATSSKPNSGSRANSITVKTTEVKDAQGRTQSITKRTVRRVNGYEYVETTTTSTQAIPLIDSDKHFDEFSGNYIIQDNGLDELSEEDDLHDLPSGTGHVYAALTEPSYPSQNEGDAILSDGEVPLDQTSSISAFSDALEYLPGERKKNRKSSKKNSQGSGKHKVGNDRSSKIKQTHQAPLTEQEMYNRALAIAQKKVYNNHESPQDTSASTNRPSTMGQRSLRTPAPVEVRTPVGPDKPRKGSKKISEFFNKTNNKDEEALKEPSSAAPTTTEMNESRSRFIADDKMYAQALAIAQNKYNIAHSMQTNGTAEGSLRSELNELPQTPSRATQSSSAREHFGGFTNGAVSTDGSGSIYRKTVPHDLDEDFSINGKDSPVSEPEGSITATKRRTLDVLPVQKPVASHTSEKSKGAENFNRKSKFKNMFDKMKQFSAENSGYQASKGGKGATKTATPTVAAEPIAEPMVSSVAHPEAVPVAHPETVPVAHPEAVIVAHPEAVPVADAVPHPVEDSVAVTVPHPATDLVAESMAKPSNTANVTINKSSFERDVQPEEMLTATEDKAQNANTRAASSENGLGSSKQKKKNFIKRLFSRS